MLLCWVLFMTEMLRRLLLVKNRFWILWQTETRSCLWRVLPTFRVGYDITWRGEPIGSNMFICFKQNTKACCEEKCVSPGWKRVETAAKLRFCNSRWLAVQLDYLFLTYSTIKPKLAEITWLKVSGIKKKHTHTRQSYCLAFEFVRCCSFIRNKKLDVVLTNECRMCFSKYFLPWNKTVVLILFWSGLHLFRIVYFHRRRGPSFRCLTEHVR